MMLKKFAVLGLLALGGGCGGTAANIMGQGLTGGFMLESAQTSGPTVIGASAQSPQIITPSNVTVTFPWERIEYPLFEVGQNRQAATYVTPTGWALTMLDGFLIATRSIGDDLMAADIREIEQSFPAERQSVRIHDYLTGTDEIVRRSFQCELSRVGSEEIAFADGPIQAVRFDESCQNARVSFTNSYWIGQNSALKMSRQWISQGSGYVDIRWY